MEESALSPMCVSVVMDTSDLTANLVSWGPSSLEVQLYLVQAEG